MPCATSAAIIEPITESLPRPMNGDLIKAGMITDLSDSVEILDKRDRNESLTIWAYADLQPNVARAGNQVEKIRQVIADAATIDADITTECIACPPDKLERDYYCGWRFTLNR